MTPRIEDVTRGLLLGAGASFDAGMPLVWDLTVELRRRLPPDLLRRANWKWRANGGGYPVAVIDELNSAMANTDMHYESVLGYLENRFLHGGAKAQSYHGMYLWLVDAVAKALYLRHVSDVPHLLASLRFLDGIAGLAEENRPLWIFTLNHDVLIELLCSALNVKVSCGYSWKTTLPLRSDDGLPTGNLAVETLSRAELEQGALQFLSPGSHGVNLLKVHGAIDVFTYNDGMDMLRIVTEPGNPLDVLSALVNANENLRYVDRPTGRTARATNEIAYADEHGEMQFLRRSILAGAFKFHERSTQTLPKIYLPLFRRYLANIDELLSIGYGFGDLHINRAIREWLEESPSKKIVVVDPYSAGIPSELLHLANQVSLVRETATRFLEKYSKRALTETERALREGLRARRVDLRRSRGYA